MLTKKVKLLRKEFDELDSRSMEARTLSIRITDEIVSNCKPTRREFAQTMSLVTIHSAGMYDMIMYAKDNWDA